MWGPRPNMSRGPRVCSSQWSSRPVHSGPGETDPLELKDLAHVHKFMPGIRSNIPLHAVPVIGESFVQEPEVRMCKVLPIRYLHMLQPTQCGQGHCKKPVGAVWAWKVIKILKPINIDMTLLLLAPPLMASRRSKRCLVRSCRGMSKIWRRTIPHHRHNLPTLRIPMYHGLEVQAMS